jgi:hypothetical protein
MPSPQPLPIAFGEYRPDISDHNAEYTSQLLNVKPRADGYGPIRTVETYTDALPSACRGYFYARNGDGSISIFAGTSDRLYVMNNTDFSWTDKSDGGAAYTALSTTAQWQFAQFNNFVLAVQANEVPQVFDLSTPSNTFEDLGGSPPQAAYIAIVNRFVVLSGLLSQPYRIQWSGLNAITTWTAGTNFSDFQDLPDGGQNRGVVGGEYGLILQEGAIRRMIYAPGSELVFQIDRVAQDRGLNAPYSLVAAGEKVFFLTAQGFVQSDASGVLNPIGKERVDRVFFEEYDASAPQLMIGVADPSTNVVIWVYRTAGAGAAGVFNKALLYDWVLNRWTPFTLTGEYIASLARPGLTLESLDSISGSLDALPFSLDDISSSTLPALSTATSTHAIGFFTGANMEATLETAEHSVPGRLLDVNGFTPLSDSPSIFGSVGKRANLAATTASTFSTETQLNADGFCPALVEGRYIRHRLRIPESTSWSYAKGLVPEARAAGKV